MRFLILFIVGVTIFSCSLGKKSDGNVEVVKNGVKPLDPNFKIDLEYVGEIKSDEKNSFGQAYAISMDSKGDIYLTEQYRMIHKYNGKGNFIKNIGKNGGGPGEYSYLVTSFVSMDTVYAIDAASQKCIKYDLDGNYLSDFPLKGSFPGMVYSSNDNLVGLVIKNVMNENKIMMRYYLSILNRDISFKEILFEDSLFLDPNNMGALMDMGMLAMLVTLDKDGYYMAESSENIYKINYYDKDGNLTKEITKNYAKIPYSKKEIELTNKVIGEMFKKALTPQLAESMKFDKKYKRAINDIKSDHLNRLWVNGGNKDIQTFDFPLKYDIFKDGKFINSVPLMDGDNPILMTGQTFILGDRLFVNDMKNSKVKMYKILN
ncbi:MAG: hypothetical protein CR982_04135 [Candidatus Cloacimonadota bacterium]|nr:MAG: hypothetical protein CR982_04135 [Candidatus Cloacimonadota bacterium]PIE78162.1 MAG: hypothetical protein CSA15_09235 [Candidatus Delongbacteria bacterium]